MLSLKHEIFLEVARVLSFTKASESLFLSQPAVSKHIKTLEDHYGKSLFERSGNRVKLTQAGLILQEHLHQAKVIQKQLEFELSGLEEHYQAKGELILGSSTTVALYIIPPILSRFHRTYPNLNIRLYNRNSSNVLKALLNYDIDMGIVEQQSRLSTVSERFFLSDEVIPVCATHSPLALNPVLNLKELPEIPLVLREAGSGTLSAIEKSLLAHQIKLSDLKVKIKLGGTEALKNFLLNDESLGFLPRRSVARELKNGELCALTIPDLHIQRNFYFIQRRGMENDRLNQIFIRFALSSHSLKL